MVKGFIVAGTHSGCGKTIVTLGLLRVLKEKGLRIQPFKVGPDYIDTSWHKQISGVASVNLDLFSMEKDFENWFWKYAKKAEISIIEGVMGLFDGDFSTFEVAKRLKLPVLLVIDVFGMAETVKAIALGFKKILQKEGIELYLVLNQVSSERHLQRLLKALKGFKILGYLPKKAEFEIPSRHLGLYMPQDKILAEEKISYLKETIEKNFDLETLL
ncbi:MAG TPA: cobyrinic acid a,c-diamide synthase, partial [Candidatus Desulfofervidus auxilii]|nr:cobyrinic acid a,c-diamide synthase [Candidatus Desulfofervidus auxilii]